MIGLTSRPPQLETPFSIFNDGPITPNNAFFVRIIWRECRSISIRNKFTLEIKGKVDNPLKLSLKEIRSFLRSSSSPSISARATAGGFPIRARRRPIGQRRDGAMRAGAAFPGKPCSTRPACRRLPTGHFQRHGRAVMDTTPDFRQGARYRPRPRRRGDAGYGMNGDDLPVLNAFRFA